MIFRKYTYWTCDVFWYFLFCWTPKIKKMKWYSTSSYITWCKWFSKQRSILPSLLGAKSPVSIKRIFKKKICERFCDFYLYLFIWRQLITGYTISNGWFILFLCKHLTNKVLICREYLYAYKSWSALVKKNLTTS